MVAIQEKKKSKPKQEWTPQRWREEVLAAIDWNEQQLAVFEEIEASNENLIVEAVAGSGKTTTLIGLVGILPTNSKINILAYNKSVKEKIENDPRIPERVNVSTAHGCCHGLLISYFHGKVPELDDNKAMKLAEWGVRKFKDAIADYSYRLQHKQPTKDDYPVPPPILPQEPDKAEAFLNRWRDELKKLLDFARLNLADETIESLEFICNYFAIRFPGGKKGQYWGIDAALGLLDDCYRQGVYDRVIDYPDMIWLVHKLKLYPRKPKASNCILLVDETQDANRGFISLYKKFELVGYRCIFVGDRNQSISGYMAALPTAMDQIQKLFNAKTLPLSETQRCPKVHAALASLIFPGIKARADAKEGSSQLLHSDAVRSQIQPGDLVICRFVAPLIKIALEAKFLDGKEGVVRGRKIADEMTGFANSIGRHCKWNQFLPKLIEQRDFSVKQYIEAEQLTMADAIRENYRCLEYCYEYLGKEAKSLNEFLEAIVAAFPVEAEDRSRHVIYSSIHSAKGDEADNVFIIGANILPYFRKDMLSWMFQQEVNATYVAITRSKSNLFFVPSARTNEEVEMLLQMPLAGMKMEYFQNYQGEEV